MFPLFLASHMIRVQNNYISINVPAGVGTFSLNNIHNSTDLLSSHHFLSTWGALCFEIKQQQKMSAALKCAKGHAEMFVST